MAEWIGVEPRESVVRTEPEQIAGREPATTIRDCALAVSMKVWPAPTMLVSLAFGLASALGPLAVLAQAGTARDAQEMPAFSQGELDAMLAPIALYPDALLAQLMMASTYPLEVVEAARWRKARASLVGKSLKAALDEQDWDESVKSLAMFPAVLDRMGRDLVWTQSLGDALLAQQGEVMDAIQRLRASALAAGHLQGNAKLMVDVRQVGNERFIVIEPTDPKVVHVPTYQPGVVYGVWAHPEDPPYDPIHWRSGGAASTGGYRWGTGIAATAALWGGWDWREHSVTIDVDRYNDFNRANLTDGDWSHNVNHRGAVPYRDAASRDKYRPVDRDAIQTREQFRGRGNSAGSTPDTPGSQGAARSETRPPADRTAPAPRDASAPGGSQRAAGDGNEFASAFARGDSARTRQASSRGHSSLDSDASADGGLRGVNTER